MKKIKKYLIGASALLIILVGCGVAVGRALNNEEYMMDETPKTSDEIMAEMRSLMKDNVIEAYIIYSVDAHNSEYVADRDNRRQYVTNFTGSAGTAIITSTSAALWTDSRYFIQAENQIDKKYWILMKEGMPDTPTQDDWLMQELAPSSQVGIDPFLISSLEYQRLSRSLQNHGHRLISLERNLVDMIWNNRPEQKLIPIKPLNIKFSGNKASSKVTQLRRDLITNKADAMVITALDDIAWLLNMRGSDIKYNPVFYAYIILSHSELLLYTNTERISESILQHFRDENILVTIKDYDDILNGLDTYVSSHTGKIIISLSCSQAIYGKIPYERHIQLYSLVSIRKAVKNEIEALGMRRAHVRDGAALIRYFHWLDEYVDILNITELSGAEQLRQFRSEQENYVELSFETISAFGSNGAIVHYSPTPATDKLLTRNNIYLVDSGGQYLDGTTDVTRSIHLGTPSSFQKECFTRVLKGFLSLGSAVFPTKTSGTFFDSLARKSLWDVGLDYGHGTGHGIGSYLGVHEYPPSFVSKSDSPSNQGVVENMFSSNEPGYYEEGDFGIRLEDIIQVVKANVKHDFNGRGALTFFTNTLVPIQIKLIETNLMTPGEIKLLNAYHARVKSEVGELLLQQNQTDAFMWLENQTKAISLS